MSNMEIMRSKIKNMGSCSDDLIEFIYGVHDFDYLENKEFNHVKHLKFVNDLLTEKSIDRYNDIYYVIDDDKNLLKITSNFTDDMFFSETVDVDNDTKFFIGSYYNGGCYYTEVLDQEMKNWKWESK